jgi:hypothetical protein
MHAEYVTLSLKQRIKLLLNLAANKEAIILFIFIISPVHDTRCTHIILLDFVMVIIFGEDVTM